MKKWIAVFLAAICCLMVTACGGSGKEVDINALADALIEKITYNDDLAVLDDAMVGNLYTMKYEKAKIYVGSGATAEEVAVFQFADEATAKTTGLEGVNLHLAQQKESYQSYIPEEVKRLEEAVIKQSGKYIALCVATDSASAEKIMDEFMK